MFFLYIPCSVHDFDVYFRESMNQNVTTLPQYFKEHGYRAISVGKVFHNSHECSRNGDPISWSEPPIIDRDSKDL